jgi:hypothetical protein
VLEKSLELFMNLHETLPRSCREPVAREYNTNIQIYGMGLDNVEKMVDDCGKLTRQKSERSIPSERAIRRLTVVLPLRP